MALKIPVTPDDHIRGNIDAPITLIEYGDFQCPHCRSAEPIVKEIESHFGDQLRYVFRNFPLSEIHPYADAAAQASEFASDYDKYWEFHDLIFQNQDNLSIPLLFGLADSLKIPSKDLELALHKNLYQPKVRSDFMGGVRSGVNGTPTFFINEERYNGPVAYDDLVLAIENVFVK